MNEVFQQYAEICNVPKDQLSFLADGETVHPDTTPDRITEPPPLKGAVPTRAPVPPTDADVGCMSCACITGGDTVRRIGSRAVYIRSGCPDAL